MFENTNDIIKRILGMFDTTQKQFLQDWDGLSAGFTTLTMTCTIIHINVFNCNIPIND